MLPKSGQGFLARALVIVIERRLPVCKKWSLDRFKRSRIWQRRLGTEGPEI
jgi:hypothetical protein